MYIGVISGGLEKFKKSFKNDVNTAFTKEDVFQLLVLSNAFSDEVAALFTAISERESGGYHPGALNGDRDSNDFSIGLFQINLLPGAHGLKYFSLIYPEKEKVQGLQLAYSIEKNLDQDTLIYKVKHEAYRATVDERAFIPYNQVSLLAATAVSPSRASDAIEKGKIINEYCFVPWGDYKTRFSEDSEYYSKVGTIAGVKYSTVRNLYLSTGKKEELLKSWIRKNFKKTPGEPYIEKWMTGIIFDNDANEQQDGNF